MMKKWSRFQKLKAVFILALAVVFTNAGVSYSNTIKLIHNQQWVTSSHEVITQIESIQFTLRDTEAAQRNYLITLDADELQTYLGAYQQTNSNIQILSKLTVKNQQKQQWIYLLEQKITNRFNILQQEVYLRQDQGLEAVRQFILSNQDKQISKEIQQLIQDSLKAEENLLQRRMHESQASSQKVMVTFFIAAVVDLVLVALLYGLLWRYVKQVQQTKLNEFDGTFIHLALMRDITQKKQAEQKIREQGLLLDVATEAIWAQNIHNQILFWNKAAESLYGWKVEEVVGKNVVELLYKDTSLQLEDAYLNTINKGEWRGEFHQLTREGKKIIVESRWTLVRHDNGQPKSILSVNTEITQQKQLEAQLLRSQRLESIGTLASGIVHDLNNILSPILMSVQLLQKKLPDPQSQRILQTLENNVKHGANLLKQVLFFARGIEGKRTIVQIQSLITEVEQIIAQTFPKSIICQTDMPKNLWHIRGDTTQLHQVLINLAINARDAMPNGGILRIATQNLVIGEHSPQINIDAKMGSYIAIVVTDTGMGMSPAVQERIFEPFFTTKEVGKGTGIGLSTVLSIIKNHGGFVNVYSQIGRGTQFTVYLPASISRDTHLLSPELESVIGDD
ncbi:PAS domain S-box protein [Nostoc sp. WHI]|nr:PAS domain S-box protein [Nostoc sp. WHI]